MRLDVDAVDRDARGRRELRALEAHAKLLRRRLHERAMRRYADGQGQGPTRSLGRRDLDGARDGGGGAPEHNLPGRVEIDRLHHFAALRGLIASILDVDVLEPEHRSYGALTRQ